MHNVEVESWTEGNDRSISTTPAEITMIQQAVNTALQSQGWIGHIAEAVPFSMAATQPSGQDEGTMTDVLVDSGACTHVCPDEWMKSNGEVKL